MSIGSSNKLTSTNLINQSFANLYNLINDRSNVPDTIDSTGTRKFVYQRIPKLQSRNFKGYPFIVVSRTRLSRTGHTADLSKTFHNSSFTITVYTRDKNSDSSGDPDAAATCENITDSIVTTLDNATNQKTFFNYGMESIVYDVEADEDEDLNGNIVYISEFNIKFAPKLLRS